MSEHAALGERDDLVTRLNEGVRMMAFVLIPTAAGMLVVAGPLARLTLDYGVMTQSGSALVARVMAGFVIGLPAYAAFLILTRAYYALGNTKTPALVNAGAVVASSAVGATLFFSLPDRWSVAGLALGHSIGFGLGAAALLRAFGAGVGRIGGRDVRRSVLTAAVVAVVAAGLMTGARSVLPDDSHAQVVLNLIVTVLVGGAAYLGGMTLLRSPELAKVRTLVSSRG
jgi:putative peptidoglycan lipid II flippase